MNSQEKQENNVQLPELHGNLSELQFAKLQNDMTNLQLINVKLKIAQFENKLNAIIEDIVNLHTTLNMIPTNIIEVMDEDSEN
tara:strand:- start:24 stop:272 length:249 start_codon:yes stop_codon:yes gene_type:complete